ncbi:hypothetical protein MN032_15000 [Agromyces atrinae]|uniref:hypothetical protein n=1 Tax=Agromyces atrinae TaxID=592376 RepID=UPI001F58EC0D|nr:hypothetical protein [Agromyces atrinae]MCI2959002.1 hypothetical protein [Agromyces atrinae]
MTANTPSASPSVTADPDETSVASVVVLPTHVEFRDAAGEVAASFDYATDAEAAIAGFRDLLGSETATTEDDGNNHFPPSTIHTWGDIEIVESRFVDNWSEIAGANTYARPSFTLIVATDAQQDIAFATNVGIVAGDDWATASASAIDPGERFTCIGTPVEAVELGEAENPDGTTFIETVTTVILDETFDPATNAWTPTDDVAEIRAPAMLTDGCA